MCLVKLWSCQDEDDSSVIKSHHVQLSYLRFVIEKKPCRTLTRLNVSNIQCHCTTWENKVEERKRIIVLIHFWLCAFILKGSSRLCRYISSPYWSFSNFFFCLLVFDCICTSKAALACTMLVAFTLRYLWLRLLVRMYKQKKYEITHHFSLLWLALILFTVWSLLTQEEKKKETFFLTV